jgi:hypothetical protein
MINWAEMNPFARADRGQTGEPTGRTAKGGTGPTNDLNPNADDPNADPNKVKNKQAGQGDDPLLKFDSLWQPNKDKDGKDIVDDNSNQDKPYLPALDSKKFDALVGGMDFSRGISAEDWKAVGEGGENAIKAMANIMNHVGRQSFKHAFQASTRITEAGFSSARERFTGDIPNHVRDIVVDNELAADNPIMKNPAFAPVVKQVKEQYLRKFPKATPQELNGAVRSYFAYMAKELNQKPNADQTVDDNARKLRKGDVDADFMEWLGEEIRPPAFNDQTGDEPQQ